MHVHSDIYTPVKHITGCSLQGIIPAETACCDLSLWTLLNLTSNVLFIFHSYSNSIHQVEMWTVAFRDVFRSGDGQCNANKTLNNILLTQWWSIPLQISESLNTLANHIHRLVFKSDKSGCFSHYRHFYGHFKRLFLIFCRLTWKFLYGLFLLLSILKYENLP